jgi:hypothetical protein
VSMLVRLSVESNFRDSGLKNLRIYSVGLGLVSTESND